MRIALLFSILLVVVCSCEPLSVEGVVVDEELRPISGVTVQVKRSSAAGFSVVTDSAGAFVLGPLQLEDTIRVNLPGYASFSEPYQPYLQRYYHPYTILLEKTR